MTPAQVSAEIERLSKQALDDVLARIRRGETPRDAIEAALAAFRGPYYALIAQALSEILKASIGVARVKAWPVGRVTLSQRLYAHHRAISLAAASTIAAHLKGPHSARVLAKTLYDGYDFKPDTLKVVAALPKYLRVEFDRARAARLKTPALRAAYLEAIRKAEAGAGMEELGKRLNVALQERNRFFANRIARTELHRARIEQRAVEWMGQEWVKTIRIRLSPRHPKADICDYHANADLYGLGPGIYPKAVAPLPPYHPFCFCLISPRGARDPKIKPKFNPKAERAYLAGLPPEQAARVAGSRDRLQRALDGETLESLYNAGQDDLYKWKRVGDVVPAAGMAVADAAQRYAEQLESLPFADALEVAQRAVDDPLFRRFFEEGIAGHYPVGVLRPEDALAMGAGSRTVFLSDRSLREHLGKHPEIDLGDYQKIPTLLDQGEVWQIAGQPERLIYLRVDGVTYRAAIKRTRAGDENYFLTLFKNTKKKPPKGAVRLR